MEVDQLPQSSANPLFSPLSEPPSSDSVFRATSRAPEARKYRGTTELPLELANHVQTYYESALFLQAFEFLISVVSNSISPSDALAPMLLPAPPHLALAATMTIHPGLTTRTTEVQKWNQANAALRLLRLVFQTAGPANANFVEAFRFTKYDGRGSRMSGGANYDDEDSDETTAFGTRYATTDSIFSRVDDIWSVIGWAFNCSCIPDIHASRWTHYEPFLTFLLDLLETDWQVHQTSNTLEESLMWNFIELASGGYGRPRRIMRAIFADGSTRSLNEFREVFHNELKPARDTTAHIKQRTVDVNIDKDEFGDYLAPHSSSDSTSDHDDARPSKRVRTRTPSRRASSRSSNESTRSAYEDDSTSTTASTTLGPPSALRLRMRLLHLLSSVSGHDDLIRTSFPDTDELYTLFVEFIKPLPLYIFQQIISPSTAVDAMSTDAASTLCERLLWRLLESNAPTTREDEYLTVKKLCVAYLPYAAGGKGSVAENARVSLLFEALVRRCKSAGMLDHLAATSTTGTTHADNTSSIAAALANDTLNGSPHSSQPPTLQQFTTALEAGIRRRAEKAREYMDRKKEGRKGRGTKEVDEDQEEALRWLRGSAERMRMVIKTP